MRGTFVGAVVILVVALGAAPAAAEPVLVKRAPGGVIEGPHLAGESVFYRELGVRSVILRLASPGSSRKLSTLNRPARVDEDDEDVSPGDFSTLTTALAASPDRLAYKEAHASGNARYQVGQSSVTLFGGSLTGPFGQEDRCSNNDYFGPASAALDADGPRVAATDCSGQIVIRDHSDPTAATTRVSPGSMVQAVQVALAGRYVAYNAAGIGPAGVSPTTTVVHDWVANQKVYEVPRLASFDLQDDGTLAASTGRADDLDCSDGKLSWFSIAEPVEHVLPVKPCTSEVSIASGRIAVVAAVVEREQLTALTLVGLDGTRTDVAQLGTPGMRRGSTDFDGARVAYALGNCLGGADVLTESATDARQRPEPRSCPLRGLPSRALLGPSDRSALVSVDCPRGCLGRIRITARLNGRTRSIGTSAVRVDPTDCPSEIQPVPIAAAARTAMRRRGFLDTRLTITNEDRDGAPRTASRSFRLRATGEDGPVPADCAV